MGQVAGLLGTIADLPRRSRDAVRNALVAMLLATAAATACAGSTAGKTPAPATRPTPTAVASAGTPAGTVGVSITVTSPAFADGATIPVKYTCTSSKPVSPPLAWSGVPGGTAELTLLVEDPDAPVPGGFVHWVVYGIPPNTQSLAEGSLPSAAKQGANGGNQNQWQGPCPPVGSAPHHYRFTLTAVSRPLGLAPGATAAQVKAAMAGLIAGQGLLVGLYGR
jgi:Raf kinase inhibitor-like YbhB/YbcL family protein